MRSFEELGELEESSPPALCATVPGQAQAGADGAGWAITPAKPWEQGGAGAGRARVRVLVAEHESMRAGLRLALEGEVELCAEVGDREQAIRAAKREQPDVCVVGGELGGDGLGAVRGICRAAPAAAVIVLACGDDSDEMLDFVRAGATGYVPAGLDLASLRRVVAAAAAREAVIPRAMVLDLLLELRHVGSRDGLTARESQVLGMMRRGHATAQIAERLQIAPVTVRRHVSDLVRKLGVEGRSALLTSPSAGRSSRELPASRPS